MDDKKCSKCQIVKTLGSFCKDKKKHDGLYSSCKQCNNPRIKQWHDDHGEEFAQYQVQYSKNNWPKVKKQQDAWRESQGLEWQVRTKIRNRVKRALKDKDVKLDYELEFGCSLEDLVSHLENQFQSGMSWDNWTMDGWHVDHIKPLCKFNVRDSKEVIKANHYTNLRPLWAAENRAKSGKWTEDDV
jgi:hypothetical protein